MDSLMLDEGGVKKILLAFEKRVTRNQVLCGKYTVIYCKMYCRSCVLSSRTSPRGSWSPRWSCTTPFRSCTPWPQCRNITPSWWSCAVPPLCWASCLTTTRTSRCGPVVHTTLMHSSLQVGALGVLQEMTDVDSLQESVEGSEALLEALVECQVCSLLVTNLDRLDEAVREESEGVHNTLSIIENLVELRPEVVLQLCQAGFLHWLVRKLKVKVAYDDNKLYASELLSILLQVVYRILVCIVHHSIAVRAGRQAAVRPDGSCGQPVAAAGLLQAPRPSTAGGGGWIQLNF